MVSPPKIHIKDSSPGNGSFISHHWERVKASEVKYLLEVILVSLLEGILRKMLLGDFCLSFCVLFP